MKTKFSLLDATLMLQDLFDLRVCYKIYNICNGKQFEAMPGTEFASFLNMRTHKCPVIVRRREKLRVCYLIYILSGQIQYRAIEEEWKNYILKACNIEYTYYKSHYKDAETGANDVNKGFVNAVKRAVY